MRQGSWLQRLGFLAAGVSALSLLLAVASPRKPADVDDDQIVLSDSETGRYPDLPDAPALTPNTTPLAFSLPDPVAFDVPPQIDTPRRAPRLHRFGARAPPILA